MFSNPERESFDDAEVLRKRSKECGVVLRQTEPGRNKDAGKKPRKEPGMKFLMESGLSCREIASQPGVSTSSLTRISKHRKRTLLFTFLLMAALSACNGAQSPAVTENPETMTEKHQQANPYYSRTDTNRLTLSDAVWKEVLPLAVYDVARHAATEQAFTGKYWDYEGRGTYHCAACGNSLFRSDAKFATTCGWPSFYETVRSNSVLYKKDTSFGMERTEVLCGRCGAHLGHLFDDGPPPTGKRFCMNSIVLEFEPDKPSTSQRP